MENRETPSSVTAPSVAYSASSWDMHKWAMGGVANYWMYCQFSFIMLIYTTSFNLDPRLVGIALFFPRLLDGLIDPFLGNLSDNLRTKWGRRRPFLFVTTISGAILVVLLWLPSVDWPQWIQFTWLTIGSILLYTTWGTYDMAYNALAYELSDDYNDRSRVFAIGGVYASIISVAGGYYYWLAIEVGKGIHWNINLFFFKQTIIFPSLGGEINGVRALSVVTASLILIFGMIPTLFLKERFAQFKRKKVHVKLWKACLNTLECQPFRILCALQIIRTLGSSVYAALSSYIGIYYVCGGDKSEFLSVYTGLGGLAGAVLSLVMWPMAKPITKFLGKRWGLILSFGFSFIYAVTLPFVTLPGRIFLLFLVGFAFIFPLMIQNMFLSSVMPDICDIDELATGERREGLFASVRSLINKVEVSLCGLLSMYILAFTGFDAHLPQQSPEVLTKMLWWGFTPGILFSALAFAISFYIPITEKMMNDIRTKLVIRRAEIAEAKDSV